MNIAYPIDERRGSLMSNLFALYVIFEDKQHPYYEQEGRLHEFDV
ncbi:hypothetical protein AB7849_14040 [Rhodanobacter sp. 115]|nr:hypothetical protein [Rhodanobacter sp. 115]